MSYNSLATFAEQASPQALRELATTQSDVVQRALDVAQSQIHLALNNRYDSFPLVDPDLIILDVELAIACWNLILTVGFPAETDLSSFKERYINIVGKGGILDQLASHQKTLVSPAPAQSGASISNGTAFISGYPGSQQIDAYGNLVVY